MYKFQHMQDFRVLSDDIASAARQFPPGGDSISSAPDPGRSDTKLRFPVQTSSSCRHDLERTQ